MWSSPLRVVVAVAVMMASASCGPTSSAERSIVDLERDAGAPTGRGGSSGGRGGATPPTGGGGAGGSSAPALLLNGAACMSPGECQSKQCVDGVCCDTACTGTCQTCSATASPGTCSPIAADLDPENECDRQEPTSCGTDGFCDGKGACRFHPATTVCAMPGCEVATERAAALCDGKGVCQPAMTKSCAPAVCVGESCGAPCATHPDCQAGFWCDGGTCRIKRDRAAACDNNAQCMSGFCTEGVCCNEACGSKCKSCRIEGAMGTCTFAPVQQDPKAECGVQPITTCGNAGGCDGKGACRLHTVGTFCGDGSCSGTTQFGMKTCDGMGRCREGARKDCAPYSCNGAVICWNACSTNEQCKAPATCQNHECK
ncbi:MAG TPA: hypothetical protein VGG33_29110 [Polyangia bacterium]